MTKERLQAFSCEELKVIAQKASLDFETDDKDFLIDEIIEAYEEDHIERQMATNLAMLIKQKKFQLVLDDDDFFLDQDDVNDIYGIQLQCDTQIHLLLRDPQWGFVYWKYSKSDQYTLKTEQHELILRIFQYEEGKEFAPEVLRDHSDFFDIAIVVSDLKWYINLPDSGYNYSVQLIVINNKVEKVLATSNEIFSPRIRVSEEVFRENIDNVIISSALYDLTFNGKEMQSSHRILSEQEATFNTKEVV